MSNKVPTANLFVQNSMLKETCKPTKCQWVIKILVLQMYTVKPMSTAPTLGLKTGWLLVRGLL